MSATVYLADPQSTDPIRILAQALDEGRAPPLHWAVKWCDPDGSFPRAWKASFDARSMCKIVDADYDKMFPRILDPTLTLAASNMLAVAGAMFFPGSKLVQYGTARVVAGGILRFHGYLVSTSNQMRKVYPSPPGLNVLLKRWRIPREVK